MKMQKIKGIIIACTLLLTLQLMLSSRSAADDSKQNIKIVKEYTAQIHPTLPAFRFWLYSTDECPGIYVLHKDNPEIVQDLFCPEMDKKYELKLVDINFDGYKDIMLLSFDAKNAGYTYWLFDKVTQRFEQENINDNFDEDNVIWNPVVDSKNKRLTTSWKGPSRTTDSTYKYQKGKRILIREDEWEILTTAKGEYRGDRHIVKVRKKGKMVVVSDAIEK